MREEDALPTVAPQGDTREVLSRYEAFTLGSLQLIGLGLAYTLMAQDAVLLGETGLRSQLPRACRRAILIGGRSNGFPVEEKVYVFAPDDDWDCGILVARSGGTLRHARDRAFARGCRGDQRCGKSGAR